MHDLSHSKLETKTNFRVNKLSLSLFLSLLQLPRCLQAVFATDGSRPKATALSVSLLLGEGHNPLSFNASATKQAYALKTSLEVGCSKRLLQPALNAVGIKLPILP